MRLLQLHRPIQAHRPGPGQGGNLINADAECRRKAHRADELRRVRQLVGQTAGRAADLVDGLVVATARAERAVVVL